MITARADVVGSLLRLVGLVGIGANTGSGLVVSCPGRSPRRSVAIGLESVRLKEEGADVAG